MSAKVRVRRTSPAATAEADEAAMRLALDLARRGLGRTSPNPPVGAIVMKGGHVIGRGWHRRAGMPHAEVEALAQAGAAARGATLYLTLEPCSHQGRTPPCAPAVIEAGVRRVVIGTVDPNPRVRGRGMARLRASGIETAQGICESEAKDLIRFFAHHVTTGMPFVRLKLAASADGRIATRLGSSRWITGPAARRLVHIWRDELDAVMVGVRTALADDPSLTCRRKGGRDPVRVIVDSQLRTPPTGRVLKEGHSPVWIATAASASPARAGRLERAGATVLRMPARGQVELRALLREMGSRGIASVLVEGGGQLAASLLESRLVQEICWFVAPILIGGDGTAMVGALGVERLDQALVLQQMTVSPVGRDLLLRANLAPKRGRASR